MAGNAEASGGAAAHILGIEMISKLGRALAIGKPERWFPKDRLATKFHDCCSTVIDHVLVKDIFILAQSLDQAPSLEPLTKSLARVRRITA